MGDRVQIDLRDQKWCMVFAEAQLKLAITEFTNRPDLNRELLAARPEVAIGGTGKCTTAITLDMDENYIIRRAVVKCDPPEFARALQDAVMGMKGDMEIARREMASVLALHIVPLSARDKANKLKGL